MPATPKKLSNTMPSLKDQKMDYLVAAAKAGVGSQHFKVVAAGATEVVVFADILNVVDMEDDEYVVQLQGETAGAISVDESATTALGFTILGAAAAEVIHVSIHGRLKDQVA